MKHMGTIIFPTVNCQVKITLHKKTDWKCLSRSS